MFFGIFGWPFIIGLLLLILQFYQRIKIKRILKAVKQEENKYEQTDKEKTLLEEIEKIHKSNAIIKEKLEQEKSLNAKLIIIQEEQTKHIEELNAMCEDYSDKLKKKEDELLECEHNKEKSKDIIIQIQNIKNENIELKRELEDKQKQIVSINRKLGVSKVYIDDKFIFKPGKYMGKQNIPVGCYNVRIVSGNGALEVQYPEELYFYFSDNVEDRVKYGWNDEYYNLEVSERTIIKISGNAILEFSFSNQYEYINEIEECQNKYEEIKVVLEKEINAIKEELIILNNEAIKTYNIFSPYETLTSEECKNKLLLAKSKEAEMRRDGKDVVATHLLSEKKKVQERTIRQMLRNFNSECNSIILSVKSNNIDLMRNKILKSFESMNKLYDTDGYALTDELLQLKLEQATLVYMEELKIRQEKEIQKHIKEQMLEEAKAEKEMEDKRRKIEKDLRQHTAEVNRIIKYMQKTNIDAEKEMYIEKIKELESKIKLLESDKENVIMRQENAKAGFVYVISNIGSFGDDIYKIGMTRRLEPMDRIKELSSASVPFEFDVHAMIFSSNAPELENILHKHFAKNTVNKINPRKEFFKVNIDEIERVVKNNFDESVTFEKIPLATEYRESLKMTQ